MSRRVVPLTLDNLDELPQGCRTCVFWELDPAARLAGPNEAGLEKESWVRDTLLEWGTCGQLCYVDDELAGYLTYAPPAYVPRSVSFPTSPASPDAVLLMTGLVLPRHAGGGLGRILMQSVAREAVRHGAKALEAFSGPGRRGASDVAGKDEPTGSCLLPMDYLLAVGFKTVRPHPRTPRLRMDLRRTVSWRADVEAALERILATVSNPGLSHG
jgi:GNAT superfamily N-acetyltransferase